MDIKNITQSLTEVEVKTITALDSRMSLSEISKKAGIKDIEAMRALQWLSNKELVRIDEESAKLVELAKNGVSYKKNGLPEKRFLEAIKDKDLGMGKLGDKAGLDRDEINISIGQLKKKVAIDIRKDKELIFSITDQGKKLLSKKSLEEKFLDKQFPLELDKLEPEDKFAMDSLKSRKDIISITDKKTYFGELTAKGKELKKAGIGNIDSADSLTPKMLKSGSWKKKTFRRYDVSAPVPSIYGGRRHFTKQAVQYIKKIWLEMGFEEMTGSLVQTSFWDLDSLFVPQDHPARDMQDTFYIKDPSSGRLPDKELVRRVRSTHEDGWTTGSKGWECKWSTEKAKENIMRTHTTVLSAQSIAKLKKSDLPAKFFSVAKVFRNETLDWKHLFEFYQVEGIVVDPNATFRHLIGYLTEFYKKMGYEKVRIRPGHFPYTEPSAEVEVFHPIRKEWVELGGSGVFRPEVVKPLLGIEVPVLAWGQGMGRIISEYWGITDIRELYKNDLKQLREQKAWLR